MVRILTPTPTPPSSSSSSSLGRGDRWGASMVSASSPPRGSVLGCLQEGWNTEAGPFFDVGHPTFAWPSLLPSPFHCSLQDCLWQAIVPCCVAKPLHFPPFDCCQQWFLFASQCLSLLPDIFVGLAISVGDVQNSPEALHLKGLNATF